MAQAAELFELYRDDIYRFALSCTRSPQEAEDICQNVFEKLLTHRVTPGKEKAWLMQCCANQCRNLLRSHWWKRTEPLDETSPAPQGEDGTVRQAVMALPPRYRAVVYLYYYEGYTTVEIGKLLKVSQSVVTTRLQRARERLKIILEE